MAGPRVLCVAGDDPGAGAGLQRDRRTIEALGGRFVGVIAVRTLQDREGLRETTPAAPSQVAEQITDALATGVDAIKTGALGNAAVVEAVVTALNSIPCPPLVVDPVRFASRTAVPGVQLLDAVGWRLVVNRLLPLAAVATPNLDEYGDGTDFSACPAVLLTGGHGGGNEVVDRLLRPGREPLAFRNPRLAGGERVHGTGCALSSALAVGLGRGLPLETAIGQAIAEVRRLLACADPQLPAESDPA